MADDEGDEELRKYIRQMIREEGVEVKGMMVEEIGEAVVIMVLT